MKKPIVRKRRIFLFVLSIILSSLFCRYITREEFNFEKNLELLSKFCTQHRNYNYIIDEFKQPLWYQQQQEIITEKEKVNYLYGHENEHKDMMRGDLYTRPDTWDGLTVKGAFYMIVSNEELPLARAAVKSIEERFNSKLNVSYPWIFLNNQPFTPDFKKYVKKAVSNQNQVYFGQIDLEAWTYPSWIDIERAEMALKHMIQIGVRNSHSLYKRQKMRYNTGLFYLHSLFNEVEYVWRVEPGATYTCDMFQRDPFQTMKRENKKIAFALTGKESPSTSYSLWPATLQYIKDHTDTVKTPDTSIMPWIVTKKFNYNFCHLWTDFEILSLDFLKSEAYQSYFHYLDRVGGFFYERWADGPIRTIAAAMFLEREEVHFMNEVGVIQGKIQHCPLNDNLLTQCSCDYKHNHNLLMSSCTFELLKYVNPKAIDEIIEFASTKPDYVE